MVSRLPVVIMRMFARKSGVTAFAFGRPASVFLNPLSLPKTQKNNTEVKFKPEHVEGTDSPMVEPITAETVTKMEQNPHGVEVTKSSSPKKE